MKAIFSGVLLVIVLLAGIFGASWLVAGNGLALTSYFAPKHEAVRRETFEQSKAYRQGAVQELQAMRLDYISATPEQQAAIKSILLHRAADLDPTAMPADLQVFINSLNQPVVERSY